MPTHAMARPRPVAWSAKAALAIPRPAHGLFVQHWIYDYGLLDEFSIAAYWAGHFGECLAAAERLLSEGKVPEQHRPRILENARFARERLAAAPGRAP